MVGGVIVQPSELVNRIISTGTVLANEEVELRSELPGRIVAISFEEGSLVAKGQVLVKIDDRELQAQLRKMQVEEKQSSDDLYRKEKLFDLKAISQEELDQAQNALNIIRAQIELIRTQISKTEIIAPFSGKIGLRQVSPGGFISSSTLVARLQQTNPVKVDFSVPEKYQEKLRPGARIDFRVEGRDSLFSGTIYAIEPRVDQVTRNIQIRAKCENSKGLLIPGAFARVEVTLDRFDKALVLPSEAIIPQLGSEKVLICQRGKVVSKSVLTGIRTEREVQILQGIEAGDTVITTGLLQLREGSPVKVKIQS
jgi:membrane fusion protein (multidrug efflux system)